MELVLIDFYDLVCVCECSLFGFYNIIILGVDGTVMLSFN